MVQKYGRTHTVEIFEAGDLVSLKIPRFDRSATDNLRVICRVLGQPRVNRYQLMSEHGLLDRHFPIAELLRVPRSAEGGLGDAIPTTAAGAPQITMRALARLVSTSVAVGVSCNCRTKCQTKRCVCKKNGLECSVHCHGEDDECWNMSGLQTRTELGLVQREDGGESPVPAAPVSMNRKRSGTQTAAAPKRRTRKQRQK